MEKSTNYFDVFIEVAEDSAAISGEIPPPRGDTKTVAAMQYEMISAEPYIHTQDDVLFEIFAKRKGIAGEEKSTERQKFFSKGQACLRASALPKRYGWGIHHDKHGRVAAYAVESDEYQAFLENDQVKKIKAMRSKKSKK